MASGAPLGLTGARHSAGGFRLAHSRADLEPGLHTPTAGPLALQAQRGLLSGEEVAERGVGRQARRMPGEGRGGREGSPFTLSV